MKIRAYRHGNRSLAGTGGPGPWPSRSWADRDAEPGESLRLFLIAMGNSIRDAQSLRQAY
jgi:hypothetical protein